MRGVWCWHGSEAHTDIYLTSRHFITASKIHLGQDRRVDVQVTERIGQVVCKADSGDEQVAVSENERARRLQKERRL